jgi:hypothetical protein
MLADIRSYPHLAAAFRSHYFGYTDRLKIDQMAIDILHSLFWVAVALHSRYFGHTDSPIFDRMLASIRNPRHSAVAFRICYFGYTGLAKFDQMMIDLDFHNFLQPVQATFRLQILALYSHHRKLFLNFHLLAFYGSICKIRPAANSLDHIHDILNNPQDWSNNIQFPLSNKYPHKFIHAYISFNINLNRQKFDLLTDILSSLC